MVEYPKLISLPQFLTQEGDNQEDAGYKMWSVTSSVNWRSKPACREEWCNVAKYDKVQLV